MTRKVMVVDDEPGIRLAVRAVLEPNGFEVLPIDSGERCIDELENGYRGVILMDLMMPGMDGWATIREIVNRGLAKGNLISVLTAKQVIDEGSEGLSDIDVYCIKKPFDPRGLVSTISEYCAFLGNSLSGPNSI